MDKPVLAIVGGFLGAGKTTLLVRAARELRAQGLRPAIITNDQGGSLVDTGYAEAEGLASGEVTGGCFCCRFSDLVAAAEEVKHFRPDVIFAEPVGSCIDLSATILQPWKQSLGERFPLAPLTVLVDPATLAAMGRDEADPAMSYLYRNQLAEADVLCSTKADLHPDRPDGVDFHLSARSGQEVGLWLRTILAQAGAGGRKILRDVDYGEYARAEAALGWLNWQAEVQLPRALSPAMLAGPFLDEIDAELVRARVPVAHLKVLDRAATGHLKASICRGGEEPQVDGDLMASAAREHTLTLNLRAVGDPEVLTRIVLAAVGRLPGTRAGETMQAFRPSPPRPEHRLDHTA
jgi:hypothetical protein